MRHCERGEDFAAHPKDGTNFASVILVEGSLAGSIAGFKLRRRSMDADGHGRVIIERSLVQPTEYTRTCEHLRKES